MRKVRNIIISRGTELLRIPSDCLMYVAAEGNYSHVVTADGHRRLVTFQLGQMEDAINEQLGDAGMTFLRLGRGLIKQELVLSDFKGNCHELSASKEVLAKLKAYVESIEKAGDE